jgi:hypothetical protein
VVLLVCGSFFVAGIIGLPIRLYFTMCEWRSRNYAAIEAAVAHNSASTDVILTQNEGYFAAKKTRLPVTLLFRISSLSASEKEAVTLLVLEPRNAGWVHAALGGTWRETSDHILPRNNPVPFVPEKLYASYKKNAQTLDYDLSVYKRLTR